MSRKRKILYTLIIAVVILILNTSKTFAFPDNMYDFSWTSNAELMSSAFLNTAKGKIGTKFKISGYLPGFETKAASTHGWCLNEYSGNILGYEAGKRMLLAIVDISPTSGANSTTATGYSYTGKNMAITPLTAKNKEFAAIAYMGYLSYYYEKNNNNDFLTSRSEFYGNYTGKMLVQGSWWKGYKTTYAPAIKSILTGKAYDAFESYGTRSHRKGQPVVYLAAQEYADFCDRIANAPKQKAISTNQEIIDDVKKNDNGIVVGPINLNALVKDDISIGSGTYLGGDFSRYKWTIENKTLKLGEGTQNKLTVIIKFKNGTSREVTYDIVNNSFSGDTNIQISTDINGNNAQGISGMTANKSFYIYIKDKNIGVCDIEKVQIVDSYQLYKGRLYMFDCTGSGGEDQAVPAGIPAGNGDVIHDSVEIEVSNRFDLSLRKAITEVTKSDGTKVPITYDRGLGVDTSLLSNVNPVNNITTATYGNKQKAIDVKVGDKITYTIRVYNEGITDGYATQITEYIPKGLKLASNSSVNKTYAWIDTGKTIKLGDVDYKIYNTTYLKNKLIKAYDEGNTLSYQEIKIECEVDTVGGGDLHNIALITASKDIEGKTHDRDSDASLISGTYEFKTSNSTYIEDDDDYDVVCKLIDIGGKVFIDGRLTKEQGKEINGKYDDGETLVEGVLVQLYDSNNNKIAEQRTNKNGSYKFENLKSDKSYYVKFFYDGVEYKATEYTHGKTDETRDSDAREKTLDRNNLNEKFSEISYEFLQTDKSKQRTISASTDMHNGGESTFIFENLNLGIYKRIKADLSLFENVLNTEVRVNGKTQKYNYSESETANVDFRYNDIETYTQNIYRSDVEKGKEAKEAFKFFITYRIKVKNESSVMATAKEIVNYYDPRYTFTSVTAKTSKGDPIKAEKSDVTKYFGLTNNAKISNFNIDDKYYIDNGYKALYIQLTDDKYVGNSEEIWVDITYELTNAAETLAKELENADSTKARNYSEIKGFKTIEGVMEDDSTPGNYMINPDKIEEQRKINEDDYNKAPVFMYKYVDPRTLEGNVWEAIINDVKEGANLYNNDKLLTYIQENGIKGIKVELIELKDGKQEIAKLVDQEGKITDAIVKTGDNGSYQFVGFIPGDYVVRFTYGETDNVIKSEKTKYKYDGNDYKAIYNGQNYQSTKANPNENAHQYWYAQEIETRYSDAYDSAEDRMKQINSLTTFSFEKARKLLDQSEQDENNKINAYTGKMELEIEYATTESRGNEDHEYKVTNVDFGLTPRTETKIKLEKEVTHVKLTLNDGTIQMDANVVTKGNTKVLEGEKIKGIKYVPASPNSPKPVVDMELEDEIIQGATLELTYNVKATNETAKEEFKLYKNANNEIVAVSYYGEDAEKLPAYERENNVLTYKGIENYSIETIEQAKTENRANKVEITQLVDHSEKLTFNEKAEENKKWKKDLETTKARNDDKNDPKINDETHDIRGETTCVQLNVGKIELASGESKEQKIVMTAVIPQGAVTDLDLNYSNNAAVTVLGTNVGRVTDLMNIDVTSEETIITDPTGQQAIYYIITGTAIVIFAVGTVLIKKFVLKKKEE